MEQINKGINLRILTRREIEYLSLIAMGFKNNQIGYILIVSENTVKKTLGNIFKKIKAKDRANAVALGFINNILTKEIIDNTKEKFFIEGWEEEIEREKEKKEKKKRERKKEKRKKKKEKRDKGNKEKEKREKGNKLE